MTQQKEDGWNKRNVDFSKVHGNDDEAFSSLLESIHLRDGIKIGDFMGGYGGVSERVLAEAQRKNLSLEVTLSDAFESQINRSYEFLKPYESERLRVVRKVEDARQTTIYSDSLDAVVIKMGLHELPKEEQTRVLTEAYRVLKPGCSIYLWSMVTNSPETAPIYREVIREKDTLAGYAEMVKSRYFASEPELMQFLKDANFQENGPIYNGEFSLNTQAFCQADMGGDKEKLREFNEFMRNLPLEAKKDLRVEDNGESVSFHPKKIIVKAVKPL